MRIPIESFYTSGSANISNLWYENGSFSVQRGDRSLFQISKDNTDKSLQGISLEQIEKVKRIGYFTIVESLGFSGDYSIRYTCRLFGGGNGPSHESNSNNVSSHSASSNNDYACTHNDRPGISIADIAEHAGQFELWKCWKRCNGPCVWS
ncbi:hypothetical protein [Candidatus Rhabdochlamydia porcellionis]|jgi:hypothetical protein|uniref:Uncharacterized protein n=1 Tax=Candidatus Rhabdochlamydia porcellionis TaxID=225148 RepID=A0ABX8Z2X8_9BACT|nr:hypothetical protein [Candidatus Rhabdochlamydia porcellionis]QZA58406.1 hypothetical protein RHAB15C_0000279 [Candidatus Rhabdochlamydia porcellionis]